MVIFFGPPGSGKSVQGQILAARHNWRWLSTGQLLRDTHDKRISEVMMRGDLVSDKDINQIVAHALENAGDIEDIILDGFPRKIEQAEWLVENLPKFNREIVAVIEMQVSDEELFSRLHIRGRSDDTLENIEKRSREYDKTTKPVVEFLKELGVCTQKVDGEGTVGAIHDRVEKALESCLRA